MTGANPRDVVARIVTDQLCRIACRSRGSGRTFAQDGLDITDAILSATEPAVTDEAVEAAAKAMTAWAQPDRDMNDQFWVIDRGKRVKAFVDRDDAVEACDALNARAALTAALPFMMAKTDLEKTD